MYAMIKKFNFLIYILVGQMIALPVPSVVWAKASAAPDPGASQGRAQKVVVLELSNVETDPKVVSRVTDTLRDELLEEPKFRVVSKAETDSFFAANPNLMQRTDVANPLNRYIKEAGTFYANMEIDQAIGVLHNTIETYKSAKPLLAEQFDLVEAVLRLGEFYTGGKKKKDAKNSFKEAVRLDPEREITTKDYPPEAVKIFVQAKQEYLSKAKPAKLDIFSNPKNADIYVNGAYKGTAPIKIDRFTQGDHFILAKRAGYKPVAQKVSIDSNYQRVRIELPKDAQATTSQPGLVVRDFRNVDEQVSIASKVGNALKADKVVLVSAQEVGYNTKITARMIDMKYYASHKPKSVEVLDLPKDTRPAANVIAKDLAAMTDQDLAKNPKKYADSEVIVIGKKKKKSWYKSPILWSVLGVLVAGGTATGVILGTRSGGDDPNTTTVSVTGAASRVP